MINFFRRKDQINKSSHDTKIKNIFDYKKNIKFYGINKFYFNDNLNFSLFCNNDCPYTLNMLANNEIFDELNSLKIWLILSSFSKSIFDIGSHVGIYTLVASKISKNSKIVSVEPNPIIHSRLLANLFINKLNNASPIFGIISDKKNSNKIKFNFKKNYEYLSTAGTLVTQKDPSFTSFLSDQINIDDIMLKLELKNIDLVKIDVEGVEVKTIDIIRKYFSKNTILLVEVLNENLELKNYILRDIEKKNFKAYFIDEKADLGDCLSEIRNINDFKQLDEVSRNVILTQENFDLKAKIIDEGFRLNLNEKF